jgi:hypothetical protein
MAKKSGALDFNFGLNKKPRKSRSKKAKGARGQGRGKGNAWRQYVGVSNAPIPD